MIACTCCCDLLRSLAAPCSTSRGLHFWEVVPLDVLLGQLAAESQGGSGGGSAAAQKLHQLLVPSYFPGPEEGVVSSGVAGTLHACRQAC